MRRIYLLRHAKSTWDEAGLADEDRPLAPRGRRATKLLADHLRREGIEPELVLCSSARRTRETLEGIAPAIGHGASVLIEPELYGASEDKLVERIRGTPDAVRSLMVIGHNPGIQAVAMRLAGSGEDLERVARKYPTGALATLDLEGSWHELGPGAARLAEFVTPKDLG
jgi:phosphohistidine phosphatase